MTEQYRGWNIPTLPTLKKYGADENVFKAIIDRQGGVCPVCKKVPSTGRGVFDHEHVRGWKTMTPAERLTYVRGVTCWFCNHSYLGRGITVEKARNAAQYLLDYALRRTSL